MIDIIELSGASAEMPIELVYFINKEHSIVKKPVEYSRDKNDKTDEYVEIRVRAERVLEEVSRQPDFLCWLNECEKIKPTDAEMEEALQCESPVFAMIAMQRFKIPKKYINN